MTDLKQMLIMLAKSEESYSKEKLSSGWVINIDEIKFYFDANESFDHIHNGK